MEPSAQSFVPLLEQLRQPALLISNGQIGFSNQPAQQLALLPGLATDSLLESAIPGLAGSQSYSLYLGSRRFDATLTHYSDAELLLLQEPEQASVDLDSFSRVCAALRGPLSDLMESSNRLFPYLEESEDQFVQEKSAIITRAYYRLLRALALIGDECALLQGALPLYPERTELCAFIDELTQDAASFCEDLGLHLDLQLPLKTFTGDIDRDKLERAFFNLISNAVRSTPKGRTIRIRLEHVEDRALLLVQDPGAGISPDVLQQLSVPGATAGVGAGFGLQYVRSVAELHGGGLVLQSQEGEGTTAVMSIKLTRSADEVLASPAEHYDYTGGLDHAHVEFSDLMPDSAYDSRCV